MTLAYPYVDHAALIESLLPAPMARHGLDGIVALLSPIADLDERVGALCEALADVRTASGDLLDICGELLGEPRGGLEDGEYRRLLAGQRVARHGAGRMASIAECFRRLAGVQDINFTEPAPNAIRMWARVPVAPTSTFTRRAGPVLARTIRAGTVWNARLSPPLTGHFNDGPTFGGWAYSLRGTHGGS